MFVLAAESFSRFRLGRVEVDRAAHVLRFPGQQDGAAQTYALQPKFLEVLVCLATRYPAVVSREALIDEVWAGNSYVGQPALTNAIWHLRNALKQQPDTADCIETFRKSGYRLTVAPVWLDAAESFASEPEASGAGTSGPDVTGEPDAGQPETLGVSKPVERARFLLWGLGAVSLLAVVSFLVLSRPAPPPQLSVVAPESLSRSPGRELFPRPSPDGQQLAYVRVDSAGLRRLYLRSADAVEEIGVALSPSGADVRAHVWDVDGRQILYAAQDLTSGARSKSCEVRSHRLADHVEQVLTHCDPTRVAMDVSADGKWLSLIRNRQIYLLDRSQPTLPETPLPCNAPCPVDAESEDHAFSPDGQSLVFDRNISALVQDLFLIRLADGHTRRLTQGHSDIRGVAWHPDGKRLVYGAQDARRREGYLLSLEEGQSARLGIDGFSSPAFARDGRLFFHAWVGHAHLGWLDAEKPSGLVPLFKSQHDLRLVDYAPATGRLVYVSNETGRDELWSSDATGEQRQKLSTLPRQVSYPKWSPDGRSLSFGVQNEQWSGDDLMVMDLATGALQRVPFLERGLLRANWARGGKDLLVTTLMFGRAEVYRVEIATGRAEKLTDQGAVFAQELPGGEVVFTRQANDGLWRLRPDQAPEMLVASPCNTRFNWAVLADAVICEERTPNAHQIWRVPLAGGPATLLTRTTRGIVDETGSFVFDAANHRILLTLNEPAEADLMRLDHAALRTSTDP